MPVSCAKESMQIDPENIQFGVYNGWTSRVDETMWIASPWLGNYINGACSTIIDSLSLGNGEHSDCTSRQQVVEEVKRPTPTLRRNYRP